MGNIEQDASPSMLTLQTELAAAHRQIDNLLVALETARQIGASLGILMATRKLTYGQAFALMAQTSQDRNDRLRDVAETVILTGELP